MAPWMTDCILVLLLASLVVGQGTPRDDTDNYCEIHLVGDAKKGTNSIGLLSTATFNCRGTKLPVTIRVHPAVLNSATVKEGVQLNADESANGLLHFEDILSLTIIDSEFVGLSGVGLAPIVWDRSAGLFYNCRFANNAYARTGGIYSAGSSLLHVYDSVFENNAGSSYGTVSTTIGCRTVFRNTKFVGNTGGIDNIDSAGFVSGSVFSFQNTLTEFYGCTFTRNLAKGSGAGAFTGLKRAVVNFTDCDLDSNTGTSGAIELTDFCTGKITNTNFVANEGHQTGAVINLLLGSKLTISGSTFVNNVGSSGVIASRDSSEVDVADSTFQGNKGRDFGGAVSSIGGGEMSIKGSVFERNSGHLGGAVYGDQTIDASFSDCEFLGNTAVVSGGAMFQHDVVNTTIRGCSFEDNDGGSIGGALSQIGCGKYDWMGDASMECEYGLESTCDTIEVSGSIFNGNKATIEASSIYNGRCANLVVVSSTFPEQSKTIVHDQCSTRKVKDNVLSLKSVLATKCPQTGPSERKFLRK